MPRKATAVEQERPSFVEALRGLADAKGLSDEEVLHALEEATERAYVKELGGGDDAVVSCHIDPETGKVTLAQIKDVVDEVEDDYLQISVEDANEGLAEPKYKSGDKFAIYEDIADASKVMAKAVKNNFRQKLGEAERTALYKIYKDHIGEMMVGTVEKSDDKMTTILIGRTPIDMSRHDLIGDEYFRAGDQIKVYIQEVRSAAPVDGKPARGPQIQATRSSKGFLKRLFEEEIHEIYDGTVVIKAIARKAGVRSKVAVYSNNEDVDATGACIGQGGSRIQKIVTQLGNGKNKEKIDVINYSANPGMFIIEACRPAQVIGVSLDEEGKSAVVVVDGDNMRLASGRKDTNRKLASELTGYEIELMSKEDADEEGIPYKSAEEWAEIAEKEKAEAEQAEMARKLTEEQRKRAEEAAKKAEPATALEQPKAEEKPAEQPKEEKKIETPKVAPKATATPDMFPEEASNPAAAALASLQKKEEEKAEPAEVKTTTTLSDLEKELADAKEKKTKPVAKTKRPRKITEEEVKREPAAAKPSSGTPGLAVYTDEELSELDEESQGDEYLDTDEDIDEDFSEYDRYYDDDSK